MKVMETLLRPSAWRLCPTERVIWKMILPNGTVVKGTAVGDTYPDKERCWRKVDGLRILEHVTREGGRGSSREM
jgi:hypothetical protein